jgi:hypothetical protein
MTLEVDSPTGKAALVEGLARLFGRGLGPRERVRAFKDFGTTLRKQAGDVSSIADQGAEALASAVTRLPIRTAEALRAEHGSDDEVVADRVIDEAARFAGWLWAAAGVFPAPPPVVHAVKVVVHSAIEIRMIGELHSLHGDVAGTIDTARLNAVLHSWAVGYPVAASPGAIAGVGDITTRLRQSYADLASDGSRIARVANRGRDGTDLIRRVGWRHHRRMRLHPRMWAQPDDPAGLRVIRDAVEDAIRKRAPLPSRQARDASATPREHLAQAWTEHEQAQAGVAEVADADVRGRLAAALALQEAHLRSLSARVGGPGHGAAREPAQRPGGSGSATLAHHHARLADDAIDRVEEAGTRARSLASWPVRLRNGLVYLLATLTLSAPPAWVILTGQFESRASVVAVAVAMCLAVPVLALVLGAALIGWLFRPWLGGRVARSPFAGIAIGVVTEVVIAIGLIIAAT